jgi:hypothetical protein
MLIRKLHHVKWQIISNNLLYVEANDKLSGTENDNARPVATSYLGQAPTSKVQEMVIFR